MGSNRLIVIQLSGGNDGLNTVVPYENDIYYKARPRLSILKSEVIRATGELGFNPELAAFKELYDNGELCIINSVGYPNPDRSHFRSMDIWQSGSGSENNWTTGWLGRYLDAECSNCQTYEALEFSEQLSMTLKGIQRKGLSLENINELYNRSKEPFTESLVSSHHQDDHPQVEYLYKTLADTRSSAEYLFEKYRSSENTGDFQGNQFGKSLRDIARLINSGIASRIYYASLSGFDTHANQKNQHNRLLGQFSHNLSELVRVLKDGGTFNDTLILVFSEFGRRVKQNLSGGTDHGTASNVYLLSGSLKKQGFYNEAPNLSDLDNGDLKYQIDFRQIYATILDKWMNANSKKILDKNFDHLSFI